MHIGVFLSILALIGIVSMLVMGISAKTDARSSNVLIRIAIAISVMGTVSCIISCTEGFGPALRAYEAQGLALQANDPWFKWLTTIVLAIGWCLMLCAIAISRIVRMLTSSRSVPIDSYQNPVRRSFWKECSRQLIIHILAYSILGIAALYVVPNAVALWRHVKSIRR